MKKNRTEDKTTNIQPDLFDSGSVDSRTMNVSDSQTTYISVMALNHINGVGQKTIQAIFDLGIINSLWDFDYGELQRRLAGIGRKNLDLPRIISKDKLKLLEQGKQRVDRLLANGISFVANSQIGFPPAFQIMRDPPRWLFVLGNSTVLSATGIVAIVGSREASADGTAAAYGLARAFVAKNIVVLSGLADGVDSSAHQGAVDYYGQTIGILGYGFEARYATKNTLLWNDIVNRDGALVTEYLPDESPSRDNFLRRNELQVALSHLVIPVESIDLASGTGATIRRALNLKKPLIGIDLDQRDSPAIKKTVFNLRSLDIPIFRLPSQVDAMWQFVRSTMPSHNFDVSARERQKRFLKILFGEVLVMKDFLEELKRASFTEQDVDWFASEIKGRLAKDD